MTTTPPNNKQNANIDFSSEKSDFSMNFRKATNIMEDESNRLITIIKNLENKVFELENKLRQHELGILDYQDQMNKIKLMKPTEELKIDSIEFLKLKVSAYEKVIPTSYPYPLIMMDSLLTFISKGAKEQMEKSFTLLENKLDPIQKKLIILKKNVRNFKKSKSQKDFPLDGLLEALNMMKNQIKNGNMQENLIYSDGYKITFQMPELRSILALLNSEIQGEEIAKAFYQSLSRKSFDLKANIKNFQKVIEIFPDHHEPSQIMKDLYKNVLENLKAFDISILEQFKLFLNEKNFDDIELQQETLLKILDFQKEMMKKGDLMQNMLDSLFQEFQNFVREMFTDCEVKCESRIKAI